MEGSVGIVSDIEWPSRNGQCRTDSNHPKYSRNQSKTSAVTLSDIPEDITTRTVEGVVTVLETYCVPWKNTTYERYVFRMTTH